MNTSVSVIVSFVLHIEFNPRTPEKFEILHYAGSVCYTTTAWLDKNRNTREAGMEATMWTSRLPIITQELFVPQFEQESSNSSKVEAG